MKKLMSMSWLPLVAAALILSAAAARASESKVGAWPGSTTDEGAHSRAERPRGLRPGARMHGNGLVVHAAVEPGRHGIALPGRTVASAPVDIWSLGPEGDVVETRPRS